MLTHKSLPCHLLDGTPVEVIVKALPISRMETFLEVQGDVAAIVQLCTGRNADEFHPASALDIADAADELNDPLAARLLKRGQALLARYAPPTPTPSRTSSPTSLPPAALQPGTPPKS
jgi:hypothetical protein